MPGHSHWDLAPASIAWQGKSLTEICSQLKDAARNGGRSLKKIHEHVATDPLVADHPLAIVLRKQPMRVTSTSTTSPSFMKTGGVRFAPTPPGVPVTMTSPGASGRKVEQ